ncbi:hypothetical protein DQG13_19825 [Paenibacillus sp. YN15]|nr:hypothetical protein DQG13_19825 [Paenibacillus sp. YN15]
MERFQTKPYDGPLHDYEALRRDVREYVTLCHRQGLRPDAFAFSTGMVQRWGYVPGRTIERMIAEEESGTSARPVIVDNGGFDEWLRSERRRKRGEN